MPGPCADFAVAVAPADLQVPAIIEATVGKNAADPKAALALIKFLQGPVIDQALKDYGMEKGRSAGIGLDRGP